MTDRPMLFQSDMVRAILDGRKTMMRRACKGVALDWLTNAGFAPEFVGNRKNKLCPHGNVGDRIWVRESWQAWAECDKLKAALLQNDVRLRLNYPANGNTWPNRVRPSIHMPRWASRITLAIIGVRVERLQDISRGDAMAEGCPFPNMAQGQDPRNWYAKLWDSINSSGSWTANPWVWCIEFKRITDEVNK